MWTMHKLAKRIIWILDGTSAEYGDKQKGQALVETALFTPILIVLLMGLVEMGWYTNNYLILLEVSRVSARFGTVLTLNNDPIAWERRDVTYEDGSNTILIPTREGTLPPDSYVSDDPSENGKVISGRNVADSNSAASQTRDCSFAEGFYEAIICLATDSLNPLEIPLFLPDDEPGNREDIIVSVFTTNLVPDPTNPDLEPTEQGNLATIGDNKPFRDSSQSQEFRDSAPDGNPDAPQIMVTGRYPSNANECASDHRDPFDINNNNVMDEFELDGNRRTITTGDPAYLLLDPSTNEGQRGFAYTGRWENPAEPGCYGSMWNIRRMESLVNLRGVGLNSEQMVQLPDQQAFVLVEISYLHELLLDFPAFSPLYNLLGGEDGAYISVWAAFPVPSAEFFLDLDQ
jgi:hypothetical protein